MYNLVVEIHFYLCLLFKPHICFKTLNPYTCKMILEWFLGTLNNERQMKIKMNVRESHNSVHRKTN